MNKGKVKYKTKIENNESKTKIEFKENKFTNINREDIKTIIVDDSVRYDHLRY